MKQKFENKGSWVMGNGNMSGLSVRSPASPRIARVRALKESDWKAGHGQGLLCFKIWGLQ